MLNFLAWGFILGCLVGSVGGALLDAYHDANDFRDWRKDPREFFTIKLIERPYDWKKESNVKDQGEGIELESNDSASQARAKEGNRSALEGLEILPPESGHKSVEE